jgi:hypothetical protein
VRVEQREEFEYHPLALLEEQGLVSLLGFHWQSIGPCVFSTFVSLLELGQEHVFVIVLDEWVGAKVIARLEPAAEQRLVSAREGLSSPTAWPKLVQPMQAS